MRFLVGLFLQSFNDIGLTYKYNLKLNKPIIIGGMQNG